MKTQSEQNARRTTGAVESSRTQAGRAVARTTARAGQRGGRGLDDNTGLFDCEKALGLPLFPEIAERRDFPLALSHTGLTWNAEVPEPTF